MMAMLAVREVAHTPYRAAARAVDHIAPDPDAIEELGREIATLSAHLHAATQRLLVLIAEFDRLRGWESCGHRSCAHWLAFRTGIDLGAAREKVRAARALEALPLTSASMARGELFREHFFLLTNVPAEEVPAAELLERYRQRGTAEKDFGDWKNTLDVTLSST
ncbi:MAG: DUF222 domain-containing protein, partial [Longimicrobiales bacterium]